ncbi:RDD family protein [Chryseobacterium terrae]|uniref:RDD family protein n=1 Tax=Chryseobacterium terrae TaxID=3163299 RepID=A0ABW8Y3G6_9FLAO
MGKNYKFIAITSMVISISGIICSLYMFYGTWKGSSEFNTIPDVIQFLFFFTPINLSFTNKFDHLEIWNFVFYILLFIGGLKFIKTKGKETRLVGFVFSVVFLGSIIIFLQSLYYKIFSVKWAELSALQIFYSVFGSITLAMFFYISLRILKIIKSQKEIDIVQTENKITVTDTPKWQRFFHWMIDLTVMGLIFTPLVISLGYSLMKSDFLMRHESLAMFLESRWALYFLVLFFIFIYYPLSEILFGSTPAKFLTESRVVNSKGESPDSSTVFLRTLCRNIPFDALSFLGKRGWHDSLSETYVVKEKRTGFKTNRLLWILPVLAIYLLVMFFGKRYYSEYKAEVEYKEAQSEKISFLKSQIQNPNTHQLYVLDDYNYYGDGILNLGFKIEKIEGNNVTIKRIWGRSYSEAAFSYVKELYDQQKDTAKTFVIRKDLLVKMFPENRTELYDHVKRMDYFESGIEYSIENIYDINAPFLTAQVSKDDNDYTNKKSYYFTY